jgi:hypothetical protein
LALLAHAFLSVLAAAQPGGNDSHDDLLIPLTRHEIRRLFTGLSRQLARSVFAAQADAGGVRISSGGRSGVPGERPAGWRASNGGDPVF